MPSGHPSADAQHPLSSHALAVLRELATAPRPRSQVNPGVISRLTRGKLAVVVDMKSPFRTHGANYRVPHLKITDAGRAYLDQLKAPL